MATMSGRCPTHSGTSGCVVDKGIRASRTSITTSTFLRYSDSSRSALAMCPGYQLIGDCLKRICHHPGRRSHSHASLPLSSDMLASTPETGQREPRGVLKVTTNSLETKSATAYLLPTCSSVSRRGAGSALRRGPKRSALTLLKAYNLISNHPSGRVVSMCFVNRERPFKIKFFYNRFLTI